MKSDDIRLRWASVRLLTVILSGSLLFGCGGGGSSSPGTSSLPPIATTQAASAITPGGGVLNGTVNPNGMATDAWFEYGTNENLSGCDNTAVQPLGSGVSDVPLNASVTGLPAATTYYFRVCAQSSAGVARGTIVSFATGSPGAAPTVQTLAASGLGADNAALSGSVNPNGQETVGWFEWGKDSLLAGASSTSSQAAGSGTSSVIIGASLSGLEPGTTYYYRVVAVNTTGRTDGNIESFATTPPLVPPTVTTLGATGIGTDNAALNGQVNPNGHSTTAWFLWGQDAGLADGVPTASQGIGGGNSNVAVTAALTGLASAKTYYYRVVGSNAAGTSQGDIGSFTTAIPVPPPEVVTSPATDIFADNVVLNGTVDPNGTATTAWFRYGTDWDLVTGTSTTPPQSVGSGDSPVPFSVPVTGLADNTVYHFRLEAQNGSSGIVTGSILSFINDYGCTVRGTIGARSRYMFFDDNNVLKGTVSNGSDAATAFSLALPANAYKIVAVTSVDNAAERAWTMQDAGDNNVFLLARGAEVDIGAPVSSSDANGTMTVTVSGTGYASAYEPPIGIVGVWDTSATITVSDSPDYVVGQTYSMVDNIVSQSGNRIDNYNSDYALTLTGTVDGDLFVYSNTFDADGWTNHYLEYSTVNAAGNRFTGRNEQSGVDGPDSYFIGADLSGVKRP